MKKLFKAIFILLMLASSLLVCSCGGGGGAPDSVPVNNDNMQALINQANAITVAQYPDALLAKVVGSVPGGRGINSSDVTNWLFYYYNTSNPITFITLEYNNGTFGTPTLNDGLLLGYYIFYSPVKMNLSEAVALLRTNGFTVPFATVVLMRPLNPSATEAFYVFDLPDLRLFVLVGVDTGNVTTEAY